MTCPECRFLAEEDKYTLQDISTIKLEWCEIHWDRRMGATGRHPNVRRVNVSTTLTETVRECLNRLDGVPPEYFNEFSEESLLLKDCIDLNKPIPNNLKWTLME